MLVTPRVLYLVLILSAPLFSFISTAALFSITRSAAALLIFLPVLILQIASARLVTCRYCGMRIVKSHPFVNGLVPPSACSNCGREYDSGMLSR